VGGGAIVLQVLYCVVFLHFILLFKEGAYLT